MVNKIREIAIQCVNEFEELLEEKNIDISSDDREGNKEEAHLYGTEYYQVEDGITSILTNKLNKIKRELIALWKGNESMEDTICNYFDVLKEEH